MNISDIRLLPQVEDLRAYAMEMAYRQSPGKRYRSTYRDLCRALDGYWPRPTWQQRIANFLSGC